MPTIQPVKKNEASEIVGAVYADILQTYSAYNLTEPHLIYQLMGHTPEHLAASWPRSRHLYAGTQEDENKSLSRLTLKDKHLVTLAVSATNNCEYCVRIHTARLHQLGTTTEELLEALSLVSAANGLDVLAEGTRAGDRPTVPPAASDRLAADSHDGGRIGSDQVLDILALYPDILRSHLALVRQALQDDGLLGARTKAMLAFAVAATNGADYYIRRHGKWLKEVGFDDDELVELLLVIDLTCGYNRYVQGLQVEAAPNT